MANGGLGLGLAANGFKAGVAMGAAGADIVVNAAADFNVGNDVPLQAFLTAATTAISGLQAKASVIATQASVVDIRIQFTKDSTRILNSSADTLTLADMNEEGANLSALSTRQQLAVQALSLANRSDQAILRLF